MCALLNVVLSLQEGFERLLSIVKSEGVADGGIIVCDCLRIVHNMLRGNKLTQKLFGQVCVCVCSQCELLNCVVLWTATHTRMLMNRQYNCLCV